MSVKNSIIFDLNLFSGSSDSFRKQFGGLYKDQDGLGDVGFEPSDAFVTDKIEDIVSYGAGNETDSILPKYIYPNRIFSTSEPDIQTDDEWKKFIIGGDFGEVAYDGFYTALAYGDHATNVSLPYTPREVDSTALQESLTLTTEYFNYYRRYQQRVNDLESELMIPNLYTFDDLSDLVQFSPSINDVVAEVKYENMAEYFKNTFPNQTL